MHFVLDTKFYLPSLEPRWIGHALRHSQPRPLMFVARPIARDLGKQIFNVNSGV